MNWNLIKEKYPKVADKLIKHYQIDDSLIGYRYFMEDYLRRNLYDFFDENGIHISIMHNHYYEDNMDNTLHEFFDWSVTVDSQYVADGDVEEPTRTEAEEQSFLKAFEILEEKL